MKSNIEILREKLIDLSNDSDLEMPMYRGWYKAHRKGPTGIGKTFEDLLGKKEDNLQLPDYLGIELKAHESLKNGLITLFTKSPNTPKGANTILRKQYGYVDPESKYDIPVLHSTLCTNKRQYNKKSNHYFEVVNDRNMREIKINVYNNPDQVDSISPNIAWTYESIENSLNKKLKTLAIISSDKKRIDGNIYYKYTGLTVFNSITLQTFLKMVDDSKLFVDLRIGVNHSGKNIGKTHDHGTGFRARFKDLSNYVEKTEIEI
ncbi:MvaI/BcnI restriction endonuclease family protein [Lactobacillus sp. DCY120]|uniref:MvaI/BcnI restriction endonuclease family protein n=1 Tax=Bombilactobacillus apium TaxID=2675299 RepID=A0A850R6I5_9LACO|nr:MvaI/BcnI family restriction endonuclease [Bombilactobacillus apium]NVY96155.1 MvaI/BcnI restriction endonuclease family protein [Bombilactobacillus apium]